MGVESNTGRILIFTGCGKGKTTAALGTALRAAGRQMRVLIIQFIKERCTGEHEALERLHDLIEVRRRGTGFLPENDEEGMEKARAAARAALQEAAEELSAGQYGMVVLDESLYAIERGLLDADAVREAICARAPGVHVVLTGRGHCEELAELADTITEMKCVKHAFQSGRAATKGIEF